MKPTLEQLSAREKRLERQLHITIGLMAGAALAAVLYFAIALIFHAIK